MAKEREEEGIMPISLRFKLGVMPSGAIEAVAITQGDQTLRLTEKQARTLARTLLLKFGDED